MKKLFIICTLSLYCFHADAQGFKKLLNKAKTAISGQDTGSRSAIGTQEIIAGLKEALSLGAEKGAASLSTIDGFFANAALKILLPPEAIKVERTLRGVGMGKQVDEAILAMNRAAEDACKSAAPIFVNSIKQMSIQDAVGILKGSDTSATAYLRTQTTSQLTEAFRPVIEQSLQKVNATKYWNAIMLSYNKFSLKKINPDLSAYVTEKALGGIFAQVANEEKNIRKNPIARTTDILKKVFATN